MFNRYPYTNFHELNLDYFIQHFNEIFTEWEQLYNELQSWKTDTTEELDQWRADVEEDLDGREAALRAELEIWKQDTADDISEWETATLNALDAWKTAATAQFEAIRVQAAASAEAAAASQTAAASAAAAALLSEAAAEEVAASIQASAAQIQQNTDDISELKTQIDNIHNDLHNNERYVSTYLQGVRYPADPSVVVRANNRCTSIPVEVWQGDTLTVSNIPTGFRAAFISTDGRTKSWTTVDFTIIANSHAFFYVNVSTEDGTSQLTPEDFTLSLKIIDKSSRVYTLESDITDIANDVTTLTNRIDYTDSVLFTKKNDVPWEIGNITIANDRWTWWTTPNNKRIRTPEGKQMNITKGSIIKLTDYTDAEFAVGMRKDGVYYTLPSWVGEGELIAPITGEYIFLIRNKVETEQTDVNALASLFELYIFGLSELNAQVSEINENITDLQESENTASKTLEDIAIINKESSVTNITSEGQYVVQDDGTITPSSAVYMYKLICEDGQEIDYTNSSTNENYYAIAFFTDEDVFISGYKAADPENIVINCPTGTAYCFIMSWTSQITNIYNRVRLYNLSSKAKYNPFAIPSYWENEISNKESTIRAHELSIGTEGVSFFFVTDTHWKANAQHSGELLSKLTKELEIPFVVFGGDAILSHNNTKQAAVDELRTFYAAYNKDFNLLSSIGNHDDNTNNNSDTSTYLSKSELYPLMVRRQEKFMNTESNVNHFYVDNESQKVRYIQVYCPNGGAISQSDLTWVDSKVNELTSDWTVVIFSHSYFVGAGAGQDVTIPSTSVANAEHFASLNSSAQATIACWIVGHVHRDVSDNTHGILVIATTTDCQAQSSTAGGPEMTIGTDTEQAFDCYQIDTTNKMIYVTRIGAGNDRQFDYDTTSSTFGEIVT